MAETLCTCEFYHCNEVFDTRTGQMGVWLDARKYQKHQQQAARKAAEETLRDREARALEAADTNLTAAVNDLSLEDLPPDLNRSLPPRQREYRIDRVAAWVNAFSNILDEIREARKVARAQVGAGSHRATDDMVLTKISQCKQLHEERNGLAARLDTLLNRSKDPSVLEIQTANVKELGLYEDEIRSYESSWRAVVENRAQIHQERLAAGIPEHNTSGHFADQMKDVKPVIQLLLTMVVVCHILLGLPRRGCLWIFSVCRAMVLSLVRPLLGEHFPPYLESMIHGFPRDIRIAEKIFNLEPKSTIYAACPACHHIYKPTVQDNIPIYPLLCNFKKYTSGSRCRAIICRQKRVGSVTANVPIKPFVTFDFDDWLASLLSRPGYEASMDGAWNRMEPKNGLIRDIFQGSVVKNFMGPVQNVHFSACGGEGAGRYLFSLGCDFFNPSGNRTGGKKISVGAISLVCLNLPIELRYKIENIFLAGIIPGPKEPRTDDINHYLRPLVDALVRFWTGVWFTQTYAYQLGRLVLCAIIAIVCDLPAARKVGGFAGHNHHRFCSVCHCNKKTGSTTDSHLKGYNNYDVDSWVQRNSRNWRNNADAYRRAPDPDTARTQFDRTGVRWSELLRLPYYDPVRFLVVDPMHNLLLGLIHEHFRRILGYEPKGKKTSARPGGATSAMQEASFPGGLADIPFIHHPTNILPTKETELNSVDKLRIWLKQPLRGITRDQLIARLAKAHVASLLYVGRGIGCIPDTINNEGRDTTDLYHKKVPKTALASFLSDWRISQLQPGDTFGIAAATSDSEQAERSLGTPELVDHGALFTTEEMSEIWSDLENFITPSWVVSIPDTFLTGGSHTLKSDEWRAAGTLYLPVTLIRLWEKCNGDDPKGLLRKKCLELTMSLCSAVIIAMSRVTFPNHAAKYMEHMTQYREQLHKVFPNYTAKCNHHMAMHLPLFLEQYGPVHGWWTFPTERMNGMLQRIPINYKPGEYERTISRTWHRSTAMRAFFSKETCPDALMHIKDEFWTLINSQSPNALSDDSTIPVDVDLDADSSLDVSDNDEYQKEADFRGFGTVRRRLPDDWLAALAKNGCSPQMQSSFVAPYIRHQGRVFATNSKHDGNSCVLIRGRDQPAIIHGIVRVNSEDVWLMIRSLKIAEIDDDPFQKYPVLRARLWSPEQADGVEAVPLSNVNCHYAKLPVKWDGQDLMLVVSMARVV